MRTVRGMTRTVVLVGNWAIKFPSLRNGQLLFIYGMLGNLREHGHWSLYHHPNLAPVYHCGPLGLFLIMKRYRNVVTRRLLQNEIARLPFKGIDNNGTNIALDDGKFVLFDYGNQDWEYVASDEEIGESCR